MLRCVRRGAFLVLLIAARASAQDHSQHEHLQTATTAGWQFMQDAVVFAEFNHQGSARGGDEFVVPNWWMGMVSRHTSRGRLTFTAMFSLDPATVGKAGYREILQAGETLNGRPLVDRQHPHDFFMQLAAVWRWPLTNATGLTLAGAPVGEPALGPIAFMHRASAIDNPTAPLGHHTLDSTHISYGVITAAIDHGPWMFEGSIFNGREPDENRWDFDFGRLDSVSARFWFRPRPEWEFQVSTGHLKDPEALEPGNIERSTASLSWTRQSAAGVASMTIGYGRNDTDHGARNAMFIEAARHAGRHTIYGRFEGLQIDTAPAAALALTIGGVRNVIRASRFEGGIGGDVTFHAVPEALQSAYGGYPVSFHVFFRLRPRGGSAMEMWNMRMTQPMK